MPKMQIRSSLCSETQGTVLGCLLSIFPSFRSGPPQSSADNVSEQPCYHMTQSLAIGNGSKVGP